MDSPLEQFRIQILYLIGKIDWSLFLTNMSFTFVNVWLLILTIVSACQNSFVIPSIFVVICGEIYLLVLSFLRSINNGESVKFFPWITTLFLLILFSNTLGLLPYGFTVTSQACVTFILSIVSFIGIISVGFDNFKLDFVKFFVPRNVNNMPLLGFLIIIETLSFLIRPLSLAIRLFANMLAGHTLIHIIVGFNYTFELKMSVAITLIPLIIILSITVLEVCIAFIQTYVFIVLTIIYIKDMYNIVH